MFGFELRLPIDQDEPVDAQVRRFAAQLLADDPRRIAEVRQGSGTLAEHLGYPWRPSGVAF